LGRLDHQYGEQYVHAAGHHFDAHRFGWRWHDAGASRDPASGHPGAERSVGYPAGQ
jgi:hypothetical protein